MSKFVIASSIPESVNQKNGGEQRMHIAVHIQADVLSPSVARRKANVWLLETVGNLLGAENPELVLGDRLIWRCDVILGTPDLTLPGAGNRQTIGKVELDAMTGDILNPGEVAEELRGKSASAFR